jgi:hypothetical protein
MPLKQNHIEFIPISETPIFQAEEEHWNENSDDEYSSRSSDFFDDEFSYKFPDITDDNLTDLANHLITGLFPSCNIGKFGKFTLNGDHGPFTEELSFDTTWFIKREDSKVTGLAIRWYDEDDDRDDECATVIYKTLLIPEYQP